MTPINFGLKPMGRALRRAVSGVTFLFRDDFTTNESAPLASPRTAEPGPGTWIITQPDNIFSIVSSVFKVIGSWGSNYVYSNAVTSRAIGKCFCFYLSGADVITTEIGFDDAGIGRPNIESFRFTTEIQLFISGNVVAGLGFIVLDDFYFIVQRSAGSFFIAGDKLAFVSDILSGDYYFGFSGSGAVNMGLDTVRSSQLPAPWDTDYGIATDRLAGARTAGDTFTHEADFLGEFEQDTIPSSGQTEFAFRMQDASNYWQVTIDSSGDIDLDEVVAGSPTQRGSSAGVIANSDRIMIICDDEAIKVYEANVLRITYSSAANFKTATAGKLIDEGTGGSVSDIISWPRTLSGTAKDALDAVADA